MTTDEIDQMDQAFAGAGSGTGHAAATAGGCRICEHPMREWIDHRLRQGTGALNITIFLRAQGHKAAEARISFHRRQGHHLAAAAVPA